MRRKDNGREAPKLKQILFICTGNTCRSPMAQGVMEKLLAQRGLDGKVACASAGLAAFPGSTANDKAVEAAKEWGIDLSGHRSRQATEEMLGQADEILVMTADQMAFLKQRFPQWAGKIQMPLGGVPDPYGGTLEDYRGCLARLMEWEGEWLSQLEAKWEIQ